MVKSGIMIFFYVDDIIFAYRKEKEEDAAATVREHQRKYVLTGGKVYNGSWVLRLSETVPIGCSGYLKPYTLTRLPNSQPGRTYTTTLQ